MQFQAKCILVRMLSVGLASNLALLYKTFLLLPKFEQKAVKKFSCTRKTLTLHFAKITFVPFIFYHIIYYSPLTSMSLSSPSPISSSAAVSISSISLSSLSSPGSRLRLTTGVDGRAGGRSCRSPSSSVTEKCIQAGFLLVGSASTIAGRNKA